MAKFNSRSVGTKTVNLAGGVAYSASAELELALATLTSFVEDKFYSSKDSELNRIVGLCEKVSAEYLGKLAVYARKEANMRSISHVLLAELARLHNGQRKYIEAGIVRIDDMSEILSYYGHKYGKPFPISLKKAIRNKLSDFDAYQFGKYKMTNKDVKLIDLFNLTHPKPKNEEQASTFKKLMKGELESPDTWEVAISGAKDKAAEWTRLVKENKLGYMALLRNLRNIEENVDKATLQIAANKIKDPIEVAKSKQLPFRFLSAYKECSSVEFLDAISEALDAACANMPSFDGQTAVFVDVSGSMNDKVSSKSKMSCAEIGVLFGTALWKQSPNNTFFATFDTSLYGHNFSSRTPLIDIVKNVPVQGGGTSTYLTLAYLTQEKKKVDQVFILSDNMGYGGNVNVELERYKREVNADVKVYAIDLAGYGTLQFPQKNVSHFGGWSEKIFDVIRIAGQDKNALVNTIKNYEI